MKYLCTLLALTASFTASADGNIHRIAQCGVYAQEAGLPTEQLDTLITKGLDKGYLEQDKVSFERGYAYGSIATFASVLKVSRESAATKLHQIRCTSEGAGGSQ